MVVYDFSFEVPVVTFLGCPLTDLRVYRCLVGYENDTYRLKSRPGVGVDWIKTYMYYKDERFPESIPSP